MKTITLKNIPDELHRTYRERARRHARSLNGEILTTLETAAAGAVPEIDSVLARTRQRVARQVARREASGQQSLTAEDYLEAIREGRE